MFLEAYRPDADPSIGFNVVSVDGTTNDPTKPGGEGNLDIQVSFFPITPSSFVIHHSDLLPLASSFSGR